MFSLGVFVWVCARACLDRQEKWKGKERRGKEDRRGEERERGGDERGGRERTTASHRIKGF